MTMGPDHGPRQSTEFIRLFRGPSPDGSLIFLDHEAEVKNVLKENDI
jgi:hypothetical protein